MCFTGDPGTGKTTVALQMADLLFRLGYLEKGHLVHAMRDGSTLEFNAANFRRIAEDTSPPGKEGGWQDLDHGKRSLIAYTAFFREKYRRVIELGEQAARP